MTEIIPGLQGDIPANMKVFPFVDGKYGLDLKSSALGLIGKQKINLSLLIV